MNSLIKKLSEVIAYASVALALGITGCSRYLDREHFEINTSNKF